MSHFPFRGSPSNIQVSVLAFANSAVPKLSYKVQLLGLCESGRPEMRVCKFIVHNFMNGTHQVQRCDIVNQLWLQNSLLAIFKQTVSFIKCELNSCITRVVAVALHCDFVYLIKLLLLSHRQSIPRRQAFPVNDFCWAGDEEVLHN